MDLLRERQVGPLGVEGFGETTRLPDRFALFSPPKYGRFLYQNECYCMFDTQQCLFVVGSVLPKIDEISGHCKQTASNHTEQLASTKKYIYRLQLHDSCAVCSHQLDWCIHLLKSIGKNGSKTQVWSLQTTQLHKKVATNYKSFG